MHFEINSFYRNIFAGIVSRDGTIRFQLHFIRRAHLLDALAFCYSRFFVTMFLLYSGEHFPVSER